MACDNSYLIKIFEKINKFSFSSRSLENSVMNWNYIGAGKTRIVSKITSDKNEFYFFDSTFIENSYFKKYYKYYTKTFSFLTKRAK